MRERRLAESAPWLRADVTDAQVERCLGIDQVPRGSDAARGELVGYLPSGVQAILDAFEQSGLHSHHTLVDLGSGAGKVVMLAQLLTGAQAIGVEHQLPLVELARAQAARLGLDRVSTVQGDARDGFPDGDVYFLYLPFTDASLDRVMAILERKPRPFIVCALGLELQRYDFLRPRPTEHFWLTLYDAAPAR